MGCSAFIFLLNLAWFLLIKRFIVKNPLRFYWEIICSIHHLHFLFKKPVPSQVLKDFSVENIQTIPSTFLSKFSSEICLSWTINYWVNHLVWFVFYPYFFLSFFLVFFHFLSYFPWQTLTIHRISENREAIIILLVFYSHSWIFI